jgi:hypothetical protein
MTDIENEFIQSWDYREDSFKDLASSQGWEYVKPIVQLISHLRELGYDKILRAGSSIYALILSRSLIYGLRDDQHNIVIMVNPQNIFNFNYVAGRKIIEEYDTADILNDKEFYRLLDMLANFLSQRGLHSWAQQRKHETPMYHTV